MTEERELEKKCFLNKGNNGDVLPGDCGGDSINESIAKDNMEGIKRTSLRKRDVKDISSVALERVDSYTKGKTKGDDDSEVAQVVGKGKSTRSKSQSGDGEALIPETPAKRRRLATSVQESLSSEDNSSVKKNKSGKTRKSKKRAPKKSSPKKSKALKKKAEHDEREYEVEKIVKVKILSNGKKEFLIRWKGFSAEHDTWEPEANLACKELVNQYFEENKEVIDASSEEDAESKSGKARGLKSSRLNRSKKDDSATDTESDDKKGTTARESRGKGKKRQRQARNANAKRGKEEAVVTDSDKEGHEEITKTEEAQGKETLQMPGNSSEVEEMGEPSGTSQVVDPKEYEVERIVDVRHMKEGNREFLIKWRGYPNKFNSWESELDMNCREKIEKFLAEMEQNSTERVLRVVRKKTNRFIADDGGRGRKMSLRLGMMPRKSYSEMD